MKRAEINRLPDEIPYSQLVHLIRWLGFDPSDLLELHLTAKTLEVSVLATDAEGKHFFVGRDEIAQHTVTYKVV